MAKSLSWLLHRYWLLSAATALGTLLLGICGCTPSAESMQTETQRIGQWRQARVANLTSENGWVTLVGLYWLQEGSDSFGRGNQNQLVLNHPALAEVAGVFELHQGRVSFNAATDGHITHQGNAVTHIDLQSDTVGEPTVLESGSLRFNAIERGGKFGVRVRDTEHPARKAFKGLSYFPISMDWRIKARFAAYVPSRKIPIVNILGMTELMESPGALVFDKDGKRWRLDAILESPTDTQLFVMFGDASNGRDSYGAGRFIYVDRPVNNKLWLDFNQAYNPPCAFTEFATCPLPPRQNRLTLDVIAGERKYSMH